MRESAAKKPCWHRVTDGHCDVFLSSRSASFAPVFIGKVAENSVVPSLDGIGNGDVELVLRPRGGASLEHTMLAPEPLEQWLVTVAREFAEYHQEVHSEPGYVFAPAASLTVNAATVAESRETVHWVTLLPDCPTGLAWSIAGETMDHLSAGDSFAVPPGIQLILPEGARFAVRHGAELPADELGAAATEATSILLTVLGSLAAKKGADHLSLDHDIDAYENTVLRKELTHFARIFGRNSGKARFETPLLKALSLLGKHAGFVLPRTAEKYKDKTLFAVCRRADLLAQPVNVPVGQLMTLSEPLLAFEDEKPFVLVPDNKGTRVYDTETESLTSLDAEKAECLAVDVFTVSPLLPERELSFKDFLVFGARANWRDATAMTLLGLGSALLAMALPYGMGVAFSRIVPSSLSDKLVQLVLALVVIAGVAFFLDRAAALSALRIQGRTALLTTSALWHRLLHFPGRFFGRFGTGDLMQRLSVAGRMHSSVQSLAHTLIVRGQHYLASLVVMATLFPLMALAMFGLSLLLFAASALTVYLQRRTIAEGESFRGSAFNQTLELVAGINKIKAAGAERWAFNQWAHNFSELRARSMRSRALKTGFQSLSSGVQAASILIVFLLVVTDVSKGGALSSGLYLAFIAALGTFTSASIAIAHLGSQIAPLIGQKKRVKPFLETVPVSEAHKRDPGPLKGHVSVDGVSFRYEENGPWVLDDVSLSVMPGQSVAIVGDSGSGKSTLLRLMLGVLEPELGSVHFDGKDRRTLLSGALRRQVSAVTQLGQAMPGSLYDNIRGASGCSIDDAWAAAEAASLASDIRAMPMGMQTQITQGTSNFSGGQIQRLMLARAIAAKPRVLMLDEATSALDEPTQARVIQALDAMTVTRIVVAHRLSTIQQADKIFVLKEGKIAESGGFDELATSGGVFAKMVHPGTKT